MESLIAHLNLIVVLTGTSCTGQSVSTDYLRKYHLARIIPSYVSDTRLPRKSDPVGDYEYAPDEEIWKAYERGELIQKPRIISGKPYAMKKEKVIEAIAEGGLHVRSINPFGIRPWYEFAGHKMIFVHFTKPQSQDIQINSMIERGDMSMADIMQRVAEQANWDEEIAELRKEIPIHVIPYCVTIEEKLRILYETIYRFAASK